MENDHPSNDFNVNGYKKLYASESTFSDYLSRLSLEIGLLTDNKQSITSFSTDRNDSTNCGLNGHSSDDFQRTCSSENAIQNSPEKYPLHYFIYNCRASPLIPRKTSASSECLLKRKYQKEVEPSTSEVKVRCQHRNPDSNISKSQTELVLNIPRECIHRNTHKDTLLNDKPIGTKLVPQASSIMKYGEECECRNISYDKVENFSQALLEKETYNAYRNESLGLEKVKVYNIDLGKKDFVSGQSGQNNNSKEVCSCGSVKDSTENQEEINEKMNKIAIKLDDTLTLNIVKDSEGNLNEENDGYIQCSQSSLLKDEQRIFPAIQVLVKYNGATIQDMSGLQTIETKPSINSIRSPQNEEDYPQIFCVNTCNKQTVSTPTLTTVCTPTTCDKKAKHASASKPECSELCCPKSPSPKSRENCSPLPPSFDTLKKKEIPFEKKGTASGKSQKQNTQKHIPQKKGDQQNTAKNGVKQMSQSNKKSKLSRGTKSSAVKAANLKMCSCDKKKEYAVSSLGSLSLFFIINNMDTGTCVCSNNSEGKIISTALICVHVGNRLAEMSESSEKNGISLKKPVSYTRPAIMSSSSSPSGNLVPIDTSRTPRQSSCSCSSTKAILQPKTEMNSRRELEGDDSSGNGKLISADANLKETPETNISKQTDSPVCSCPSAKVGSLSHQKKISVASKKNTSKPAILSICSCPSIMVSPHHKENQTSVASKYLANEIPLPMKKSPHAPSQIRFCVSVQAGTGKSCSAMVRPEQVSATTQCQSGVAPNEPISIQACVSQKSACVQPSATCALTQHQRFIQTSASNRTSVCSTSICSAVNSLLSKKPSRNICSPTCAINLPVCRQRKFQMPKCTSIYEHETVSIPSTCSIRVGPSQTNTKNVGYTQSEPTSTCSSAVKIICGQLKSSSICKGFDSKQEVAKKVCSFSGECKLDECKINRSNKSSRDSCSICKELAKLTSCEIDTNVNENSKIRNQLVKNYPPSCNLKKSKNFKQLSHLDVAAANDFVYSEGTKNDLQLITEDYDDLTEALEKFMKEENQKISKCKYIKKG